MSQGPYTLIHRPNPIAIMPDCPVGASVAFKALGGKFVTQSSYYYILAVAGSTQLAGWADVGEFTSQATNGYDKLPVVVDLNAIFELPVDATNTALTATTLLQKRECCMDLIVSSGIQGVDPDATVTDVVKMVGGSVAKNTAWVMLNATLMYTRTV